MTGQTDPTVSISLARNSGYMVVYRRLVNGNKHATAAQTEHGMHQSYKCLRINQSQK